jgi:hypothetical protein
MATGAPLGWGCVGLGGVEHDLLVDDLATVVEQVEAGGGQGHLPAAQSRLDGKQQQRVVLVADAGDQPGSATDDTLRELHQTAHVVLDAGEVGAGHQGLGRGHSDGGREAGAGGVEIVIAPSLHVGESGRDGGWLVLVRHLALLRNGS